ncbi:hypothetical protein IEQ34_025475 [Dendrobium chrysotoxum]|uniref:Ribulose bisphosphate carboxylase large subunit C-terminal domain-containing protein n=1 Tax=Dendrobium chrysotoxum TaxID=161865 RepID=A0AAV7FPE2_DENCH|nr:hypothetical protein IEQ34_025475 [Dendrobium chrysotoxum]
MQFFIDRKNHGMHFRVLAKALRMSGGDHIHAGTVVGKLEGEREMTLGFVDLLRDDFLEKDRSRGLFFISLKTGSLCQVFCRGFRGYSCLAYACPTKDLGMIPYYSSVEEFRAPLGKCTRCSS